MIAETPSHALLTAMLNSNWCPRVVMQAGVRNLRLANSRAHGDGDSIGLVIGSYINLMKGIQLSNFVAR